MLEASSIVMMPSERSFETINAVESRAACIEERWMPPANDMLIGMSRTVQDGRTTSFEFMRIVLRGDGIYFVAQPGGRPPVDALRSGRLVRRRRPFLTA